MDTLLTAEEWGRSKGRSVYEAAMVRALCPGVIREQDYDNALGEIQNKKFKR